MRLGSLFALISLAAAVLVLASGVPGRASAGPGGFSPGQPAGTRYRHQADWEPAVAVDPRHPDLVCQLITGISARQCAPGCPGTSVLFRKSTGGGAGWRGPVTMTGPLEYRDKPALVISPAGKDV